MNRKSIIATLTLVVAAIDLWFWSSNHVRRVGMASQGRQKPDATPGRISTQHPHLTASTSLVPTLCQQISLKGRSREDGIREYLSREQADRMYDWKVPIRLYGKVSDQDDNPVSEAIVWLQWVNRQGPEGVGEASIRTDDKGRFMFDGVNGKNLSVRIVKSGYYDLSPQDNQVVFEFADPSQAWLYEPDADHPVAFRLRKRGSGVSLVRKVLELQPPIDGTPLLVDLITDLPSGPGHLKIQTWKSPLAVERRNAINIFPYDWRIVVSISEGGLLQQNDVFAFEAPEVGYTPSIEMSLHVTGGASGDITAQLKSYFFFGQPRKYGVMHLKTDGDRPYVDIDYSVNPTGSRSLESIATRQR